MKKKKKNCPKKKNSIENPKFFLSLIIKGVAYIIIVGILSYNYSLIHIVSLILVSFLFLPCFSCSCFLDLNTSWDKTRLHCLDWVQLVLKNLSGKTLEVKGKRV